ncbi:hypothetical protein [Streptomyces solaniscabiei]|uniref:hypothetical protein n=1 Tax=Streptomyces solaniscabiei TaxID=2683255 RepID=UPI001CE2D8D6|nr:hypothetical protein [Streptomyces solaniscabiei]
MATAIRPGRFHNIGTVIAVFPLAATITRLGLRGAQPYVCDLLLALTVSALPSRRHTP